MDTTINLNPQISLSCPFEERRCAVHTARTGSETQTFKLNSVRGLGTAGCMDRAMACVCEHTFLKGEQKLLISRRVEGSPLVTFQTDSSSLLSGPREASCRQPSSTLGEPKNLNSWSSSCFTHRSSGNLSLSLKMTGRCSVWRPTGSQQGVPAADSEDGLAAIHLQDTGILSFTVAVTLGRHSFVYGNS